MNKATTMEIDIMAAGSIIVAALLAALPDSVADCCPPAVVCDPYSDVGFKKDPSTILYVAVQLLQSYPRGSVRAPTEKSIVMVPSGAVVSKEIGYSGRDTAA